MSRLIDAELLDCVSWKDIPDGYKDTFVDGARWILEQIDAQPTIERKKGKWIHDGSKWKNRWICSECGHIWMFEPAAFCDKCGAEMEEAE